MPDLSLQKKARRLRIYISGSDRWRGKPLESAILDTLRFQGIAGATVFNGSTGFGPHSLTHADSLGSISSDQPVVIETVDSPQKISMIIDMIYPMVREGLITVEDVQIVKYTHRLLNPLPADRLVADAMTREVIAISEDATIHDAWLRMLDKRVKAMPVTDSQGCVVGILTDEDLLERAGIHQRLSIAIRLDKADVDQDLYTLRESTQSVREVMTQPAVTILETDTLGAATTRMVKAGLKRLPVVNEQGVLVGMLSRLDVLRQVAQVHTSSEHTSSTRPKAQRGSVHTVQDIMTKDVPMVHQDEGLSAMIEKFAHSNSHRLIVVNSYGQAVGLISDSDIVARVQPAKRRNILDALRQAGQPPPGKETALDLMSPGPLTARPDLPVIEAVRLLLAESRKWLVVVDEDERPLGLVDRRILLETIR